MSELTEKSGTTAATSPAMPAQQALAAFEAKQLTRRAALAKLGIRSAAAVLAAFSIDDLARKVGQAMEQRTTNNQVANAVAKEFQAAGLAFADDANPSLTGGGTRGCEHPVAEASCFSCGNSLDCTSCCDRYCQSIGGDLTCSNRCAREARCAGKPL